MYPYANYCIVFHLRQMELVYNLIFYYNFKKYLFTRKAKQHRHTQRSSICVFIPQMATMTRTRLVPAEAKSLELYPNLPCGWQGPKNLEYLPLPVPDTLAVCCIRSGAAGTQPGTYYGLLASQAVAWSAVPQQPSLFFRIKCWCVVWSSIVWMYQCTLFHFNTDGHRSSFYMLLLYPWCCYEHFLGIHSCSRRGQHQK